MLNIRWNLILLKHTLNFSEPFKWMNDAGIYLYVATKNPSEPDPTSWNSFVVIMEMSWIIVTFFFLTPQAITMVYSVQTHAKKKVWDLTNSVSFSLRTRSVKILVWHWSLSSLCKGRTKPYNLQMCGNNFVLNDGFYLLNYTFYCSTCSVRFRSY